MLSGEMISILIATGVVTGVLGFTLGSNYFKSKGVDINKIVDNIKTTTTAVEPIINLLPDNSVTERLKVLEKWAIIGAGRAEQICHAGDISKDKRAEKAEEIALAALKELGVEIDSNKKILIDAVIKDTINKFGHTDPSEAEKESEKLQLQNKVTQLTNERDTLKNTISQINATTASTVQATQNI